MKQFILGLTVMVLIASCANNAEGPAALPAADALASTAEIQVTSIDRLGYLRDMQLANGKLQILVKTKSGFEFLPGQYDGVLDPYISSDDTYKYDSEFSSRAYGFRHYKNHRYDSNLIAVKVGELWGFVDVGAGGLVVIPPQYRNVHPFKEGLAAVLSETGWGFIDEKNNMVVDPKYAEVQDFFSGMCIVSLNEEGAEFWGSIDKDGRLLFKSEKGKPFKYIDDFYEKSIARAVGVNYETYAISPTGNILVQDISKIGDRGGPEDPFFYFDENSALTAMAYFNNDVYRAQAKKSESRATFYGAFDRSGTWVIKPDLKTSDEVYEKIGSFQPQGTLVPSRDSNTGKYGYRLPTGEWKIKPVYDYAASFSGESASVEVGDKYGLIDMEGKWKTSTRYDSMRHIDGNLYEVKVGGKAGIILGNGKVVVTPKYDRIGPFDGSSPLYVEIGEKRGFVDRDGKWIVSADKTKTFRPFKNGIAFQYTEQPSDSKNSLEHKLLVEPLSLNGDILFKDQQRFEIYEEPGI